jgi:Putative endonuclease segE, GIY-YIG domain
MTMTNETGWHSSDGTVIEEFPPKAIGFVYKITRKIDGKFYIGKKKLTFKRTKTVKGKKKKILISSDWKTYYGSSEELNQDVKILGEEAFYREILHICYSLSECSYRETEEIFAMKCLLREDSYNSWVSARITKKHVLGKIN